MLSASQDSTLYLKCWVTMAGGPFIHVLVVAGFFFTTLTVGGEVAKASCVHLHVGCVPGQPTKWPPHSLHQHHSQRSRQPTRVSGVV